MTVPYSRLRFKERLQSDSKAQVAESNQWVSNQTRIEIRIPNDTITLVPRVSKTFLRVSYTGRNYRARQPDMIKIRVLIRLAKRVKHKS